MLAAPAGPITLRTPPDFDPVAFAAIWADFMRDPSGACELRPADDFLTIPPLPPPAAPVRLVLVAVHDPDRPLRLRHTIAYVDSRHRPAIEREWNLVRTTIDGGDQVEGVYLLVGRA